MSETIENPRYDLDGDRRTYVTFIDANGEKIVTGVLPGHIVPHWQKEGNGKFGVHTGEFITDPDVRKEYAQEPDAYFGARCWGWLNQGLLRNNYKFNRIFFN